ncbi:MAG: ABC transporter permease [Bacillota bacterium]
MRTAVRILQRVLGAVPLLLALVIATFIFVRMIPGDPVDIMLGQGGNVSAAEVAALRQSLGLDEPLQVQLARFLRGLLQGDLGHSFWQRQPVARLLVTTLPATVELALAALFFALAIGIPVGILSAVRPGSLLDRLAMTTSFLGISMPAFWAGLMLMFLFGVKLRWLPTVGRLDPALDLQPVTGFLVLDSLLTGNWPALRSALAHLVLPGLTLGLELMAIVARVMRSSMLEALQQDYIRFARAKGVSGWAAVLRHALPNALVPTVTVVGLQMGVLLGGNMVVETVFAWPGLGRLVVGAIFARDYAVVQGAVLLYATTFVLANLLVDILYVYLNPKLSL